MSKDNKIIYGFHSITSRIRLDASSIKEIYLDEMRSDGRVMDLMKLIKENGIKHHLSSKDRLDGMATKFKHQGVIALVIDRKEKYQTIEDIIESDLKEPPLILILDGRPS